MFNGGMVVMTNVNRLDTDVTRVNKPIKTNNMGFIFVLLLVVVIVGYNVLSWGLVVYKFYGWFVFDLHPSLPYLTYQQWIGVMFFLNVVIRHHSETIKDEYKDKTTEYLKIFLSPWFTLLLGWVIHQMFW